ncbi:MAG TPA: sigma-70 family RNA polymerase sigma factor [Acidimicrobiales bacterium]|nr:sigma-70 family RNA polymerase sigma factor [Acidimicrobiales bacterium]
MAAGLMTPPLSRREGAPDPAERSSADETVRRNWSFVFRIISSSVRQTWESEELTQEVFARALPHLGDRQDDERSRAYLAQAARNILRDRWRHRQYVTVETGVPDAPGSGPDPELIAVAESDRAVLVAALRRLPEEQRIVLRLRVLEGLPAAEVAARLGRNADAVRQLQHRALLRLRDEFLSAAAASPTPRGRS